MADRERPVLLNNWEATYFDFDEEKILGIAETGKELGVELFVLGRRLVRETQRRYLLAGRLVRK